MKIYIPSELIQIIISNLEYEEIIKLKIVCKQWKNIISNDNFWLQLYFKHFGEHIEQDYYKEYVLKYIKCKAKERKLFRVDPRFIEENFSDVTYSAHQYMILSSEIIGKFWNKWDTYALSKNKSLTKTKLIKHWKNIKWENYDPNNILKPDLFSV